MRKHDARPVIVGEDQRPLKGARRKHDLIGADMPNRDAREP
jgi:hypothetical protein